METATLRHGFGAAWLDWRGERIPCAIGRAGVPAHKVEGDGGTPAGTLVLRRVLYRADRIAVPATRLPRAPIGPDDGWCDDAGDLSYNRLIRLPYSGRHERLWRDDALYDLLAVLGWNDAPVVPGRGSAIFLHVATADLAPTEGCVAVPLAELRRLLGAGLGAVEVGR